MLNFNLFWKNYNFVSTADLFEPNNAKNNFHNILGQTFHKLSEDCMVTGQLLNFYYFKGKDVNNETRENLANVSIRFNKK